MIKCTTEQENNSIEDNALFEVKFGNFILKAYGTKENPLFKVKDVGDLLEINQYRKLADKLDDDCKVLKLANTVKGPQKQWFLTEGGLYETIYTSKKPVAKMFRKQVNHLMKEMRLSGNNQLQREKEQLLIQSSEQVEKLLSKNKELREENKRIQKQAEEKITAKYQTISDEKQGIRDCALLERFSRKKQEHQDRRQRLDSLGYKGVKQGDYPDLFKKFVEQMYEVNRKNYLEYSSLYFMQEILYDFEWWLLQQNIAYPGDEEATVLIKKRFENFQQGYPEKHEEKRYYGGITPIW